MTDPTQNKPCPFCGGHGFLVLDMGYGFVMCKACRVRGPGVVLTCEDPSKEDAASVWDLWNRRHEGGSK